MRITWLLEDASQIWGGVKVALEDANWLHRRGHEVTVLSRSGPPAWMQLECAFRQVQDFRPEHLPDADVVIGTFWTTVPWAAAAGPGKGVAVHYCQGFEGDAAENAPLRDRIESVYRLPGVRHVTISSNLTRLLHNRFGIESTQIIYAIDHDVHYPDDGPDHDANAPLRVGIVGPYQISWKDLPTGYAACRLAHAAGQPIVLVRATNTEPDPAELNTPFPVEWHRQLPPSEMGDYYRSLDLFVGTSLGDQEGFFLPAVEAMACGVPAVLTDIPCFRSHGNGGGDDHFALFVPPQDPAAMAEAIVVAGRVPDVRSGLRREGLAVAARYSRDHHGEQLESTLRRFADEAGQATPSGLRLVAMPETGGDSEGVDQELAERLTAEARGTTDSERAARLYAAAICVLPDDVSLERELAQSRQRAGDDHGALAIYDALAQAGADDEELHIARGNLLHALNRYDDAAQAFRAAIAVGGRTADAFNRLGVVLYQAGDVAGARENFERALALEPDHADAKANLSSIPAA